MHKHAVLLQSLMMGHTVHLNGQEFNGRAIIADDRNGTSTILVRDLKVCKPAGSNTRPSSRGASTANTSAAPETPLYATAGPIAYPESSMFSTPTSTTSSSFSQVGTNSHTTSSSYSSSPAKDLRPREFQCFMSMPAARELMPRRFAQGGAPATDSYIMPMSSSSFMTSPDISFSQGHVAGYDHIHTGFSHHTHYSFGPDQQSFMSAYPPSSDGSQAMYNASTAYAVQPPTYNDYYPPSMSTLTTQVSNMAIESPSGGSGGIIYTEQRGVHIRDISRRASEDQIRKMIRDVTGPDASLIEMIKIPAQDGNPRGHAFIHCRSANLAKRMVDDLDGYEFKGRKLQARLMKEGEAISSGGVESAPSPSLSSRQQRSSSSKHHRHRKEDGRRPERKERDSKAQKSASRTPSATLVSSTGSKTAPLVVGGNVATASSSASSKENYGKKSSVVIADGSSGRRPSDAEKR